jgi:hypothetical protein
MEKRIDNAIFSQVRHVISDIAHTVENSDEVPKSLVGTLYFIVFSLLSEADHAKQPETLVAAAWTLQEDLRKVFGPKF